MTRIKDLHKRWMKDPEYRREYDALEGEFALAAEVAKARSRAGLSLRVRALEALADEDHAEHYRAPRKRPRQALDAHARPLRQGDGASSEDQL